MNLKAGTNSIEFRANGTGTSPLYFDDVSVIPTVYDTGTIIQENGAGFGSVNGSIDNTYSGYTGNGYANTGDAYGASIDWNVNFNPSITKSLTFRYASTNNSTADLLVNGINVASNIQFPSTGAWTNWDFITVYPFIVPGTSVLRLQATANGGLPNIDYIEISGMQSFLAAPTGLTAVGNNGLVNLVWIQSTNSDVTTNLVYRSATGTTGSFSLIVSLPATTAYAEHDRGNWKRHIFIPSPLPIPAVKADCLPRPWHRQLLMPRPCWRQSPIKRWEPA